MNIDTLRRTRLSRKAYFELDETWKFFGFGLGSYQALFEMVWPIIENLATEKEKDLVNATDLDAIIAKHKKLEEQLNATTEYVLFVCENKFLTSREKVNFIEKTKDKVLANLKVNAAELKAEVRPQFTVIANILREIGKATHRTRENTLIPIGEKLFSIENFLQPFEDEDNIDGTYTLENIALWIETKSKQFTVKYSFNHAYSNVLSQHMDRAQVNYTGLEKDSLYLSHMFWEKINAECRHDNKKVEERVSQLVEEARHEMETEWLEKNRQAHVEAIEQEQAQREFLNKTKPQNAASWFDKIKRDLPKI